MNQNLLDLIKNYSIPRKYNDVFKNKTIISVSGPTSSGKDTLINEILKDSGFIKIKTYTTRKPRQFSQKGAEDSNYFFIDFPKAEEMILNNQFFEVAIVHQNIYGTTYNQFEEAFKLHKKPILNIDIQGVLKYQEINTKLISFFLLPPDFKTLLDRYFSRQTDLSDLKTRLHTSLFELKFVLNSDHFYQIISDDLNQSIKDFKNVLDNNSFKKSYPELIKDLISDIEQYLKNN